MSNDLHCLAPFGGALGTDDSARPSVPGLGSFYPASGASKGTVVYFHGAISSIPTVPLVPTNGTNGQELQLQEALATDGWGFLYSAHPEDGVASGDPLTAIVNDITNDTYNGGFGARFQETVKLQFTHIRNWCMKNSPGPIGLIGFSEGAWFVLTLLAAGFPFGTGNGDIIGAVSTNPVTIWSNVNPIYPGPNTVVTTGMDLSPTQLNGIGSTPVLLAHGAEDPAIGFGGITTVASGSNGVDVTTFTSGSPGTLHVADASEFQDRGPTGFYGPGLKVATSTGFATLEVLGTITGNAVAGCILTTGNGTLSTGGSVVQALIEEIGTNAIAAGANVTVRSNDELFHGYDSTDTAAFVAFWEANVDTLL